MKRKKLLIGSVVLFLGVLLFLYFIREPAPPQFPEASAPGTVILASNGCCFWVEDVRVWLSGQDGNAAEISYNPAVYEDDVFSHPIPDYLDDALDFNVEFSCFYGDECLFSMPVLHADNVGVLKKNGVLLYFEESDDMYLNVISGDYRARYKMGSKEERWSLCVQTP